MSQKAVFITIEGVEGVGKTTNIEFIKHWLQSQKIEYVATREPGGTALGEEIRNLLLTPREGVMDGLAELLLIFAARAQHLNEVIKPALARGCWVLCDRFTDATYAYQGAGRKLGKQKVSELENLVQGELRPDLTIILDLPVELGLQRIKGRGELDRFETEQVSFFETVRESYLSRAKANPVRYRVIDASQPLEQVQESLEEVLNQFKKV